MIIMKKVFGTILIVVALGLAIYGYNKYEENQADVSIGDVELSVQEKSNTHLLLWGGGAVALIVGIVLLARK